MNYSVQPGKPQPLGATVLEGGVNFSVFSENATGIELLLFDDPQDPEPSHVFKLDPEVNKTYTFWHILIEGLQAGVGYAYRVEGPWQPEFGFRFDRSKVLIDPYAKANSVAGWDRGKACVMGDNLDTSMRSVVLGKSDFDWEGDQPLRIPKQKSVIYEMHVGGFTKADSSNVKFPGTYLGLIEKIPYLQQLGVTAVELMPVHQFDEADFPWNLDPKKFKNYWGYSPISMFALHPGYCVSHDAEVQRNEFKQMVKALHKAGIEVILDMVFNHTSEGDHTGPTFGFRGLDNRVYYHLSPTNQFYYINFSGCGNTLNCNHPIVSKLIRESLEYWVSEMHVDGFRLDEGSILSRNLLGVPEAYPRVLWEIELSEVLADTKLFTEAWDAGGLYEVGSFPGYRWSEWNGKYRDCIRRVVRGEKGWIGELANRISGSADLYERAHETPINSLNYITCHDGMTLMDLVSYNSKHNELNGENNGDGINENYSWNCGWEGETTDEKINKFRLKQLKNFFTLLLLAQGVPMICYGDEVGRTQKGNNNTYAHDSEINWFDWKLIEKHKELWTYVKQLIEFRRDHEVFQHNSYFKGVANSRGLYDLEWHGCTVHKPGWLDKESRVLAMTLGAKKDPAGDVYIAINMDDQDLDFEIPPIKKRKWHLAFDTSRLEGVKGTDSKKGIRNSLKVSAKSIVVLESR